jgi:hypothetical protein
MSDEFNKLLQKTSQRSLFLAHWQMLTIFKIAYELNPVLNNMNLPNSFTPHYVQYALILSTHLN